MISVKDGQDFSSPQTRSKLLSPWFMHPCFFNKIAHFADPPSHHHHHHRQYHKSLHDYYSITEIRIVVIVMMISNDANNVATPNINSQFLKVNTHPCFGKSLRIVCGIGLPQQWYKIPFVLDLYSVQNQNDTSNNMNLLAFSSRRRT